MEPQVLFNVNCENSITKLSHLSRKENVKKVKHLCYDNWIRICNSVARCHQKIFFWHDFHRLEKHLLVRISGNFNRYFKKVHYFYCLVAECRNFLHLFSGCENDRVVRKTDGSTNSRKLVLVIAFFSKCFFMLVDAILSDWIQNSIFISILYFTILKQ